MRDYRGKRIDNGEWVKGWLIKDESGEINIVNNYGTSYSWDEVDPETVGQYTGLPNKKVWEGDIIKDNLGIGKVEYCDSKGAYRVCYTDGALKWFVDYTDTEFKTIEVIGNIHDNPDLLGG